MADLGFCRARPYDAPRHGCAPACANRPVALRLFLQRIEDDILALAGVAFDAAAAVKPSGRHLVG